MAFERSHFIDVCLLETEFCYRPLGVASGRGVKPPRIQVSFWFHWWIRPKSPLPPAKCSFNLWIGFLFNLWTAKGRREMDNKSNIFGMLGARTYSTTSPQRMVQ